jgi:hypothetical protein
LKIGLTSQDDAQVFEEVRELLSELR